MDINTTDKEKQDIAIEFFKFKKGDKNRWQNLNSNFLLNHMIGFIM